MFEPITIAEWMRRHKDGNVLVGHNHGELLGIEKSRRGHLANIIQEQHAAWDESCPEVVKDFVGFSVPPTMVEDVLDNMEDFSSDFWTDIRQSDNTLFVLLFSRVIDDGILLSDIESIQSELEQHRLAWHKLTVVRRLFEGEIDVSLQLDQADRFRSFPAKKRHELKPYLKALQTLTDEMSPVSADARESCEREIDLLDRFLACYEEHCQSRAAEYEADAARTHDVLGGGRELWASIRAQPGRSQALITGIMTDLVEELQDAGIKKSHSYRLTEWILHILLPDRFDQRPDDSYPDPSWKSIQVRVRRKRPDL